MQGLATVVLVVITAVYVRAAKRSAAAAEQSTSILAREDRAEQIGILHRLQNEMVWGHGRAVRWADALDPSTSRNTGQISSGYQAIQQENLLAMGPKAGRVPEPAASAVFHAIRCAEAVNRTARKLRRAQQNQDHAAEQQVLKDAMPVALEAKGAFKNAEQAVESTLKALTPRVKG